MKIIFIKPNMGLVNGRPYIDKGRMEPLTFAFLKGATPAEHETVLYDDRYELIPYDEPADIVAINTEIYTARRAYEIAGEFRKRGILVIMGGCHTTMIPKESLEHCDTVVIGDAEPVWQEILDDVQSKHLKRIYRGSLGKSKGLGPSEKIWTTDYSIFEGKSYLPVRLAQFSRGCQNHCEYCATGAIYKRKSYHQPVHELIKELETCGRKLIFFVDDNIVADKKAAKELFTALIPLKIRWFSQGDISFAEDPLFMQLMIKSGCVGMVVGFESINYTNLKQMKKNCNLTYENYDQLIEKTRNAGIFIWAAFLLGYDKETPESIKKTLDWALSKKFAFAAFNISMPYPGTEYYTRMAKEKRLLFNGNWWLHDDYSFGASAIQPTLCSPEELSNACLEARMSHSSIRAILSRSLDRKTHMKDIRNFITYFLYNPLFRDEMKKKHGMLLGYRGSA